MSDAHARTKFSVTVSTDDEVVLHCLRAVAQYAEKDVPPQIAWGGTTGAAWRASNNEVTFRFSSRRFRDDFVREANRVLPKRFSAVRTSNNDPATPRRVRR